MCGIWSYFKLATTGQPNTHNKNNATSTSKDPRLSMYTQFMSMKNRGPDRSKFLEFDDFIQYFLGFHRLAIMDLSTNGDQPFRLEIGDRTIYCLCNGELYNYKELIQKYDLKTTSNCDCEIIPLIYKEHGFSQLMQDIKTGEFSCVLIDVNHRSNTMSIHIGRDPCGVRPLFIGQDQNGIGFSSELKGLIGIVESDKIEQFPPGHYMSILISQGLEVTSSLTQYHKFRQEPLFAPFGKYPIISPYPDTVLFQSSYVDAVCKNIRERLTEAVIAMMDSDRPLGALLSGGLDSSIIVAIASKYLHNKGKGTKLRTFSIGMPGATDEQFAKSVASFCDTDHTHIELRTDEFLDVIPEVILAAETYDITTVRATAGQLLAARKVSQMSDIKVLLIGDGSDELTSGYLYFHEAPDPVASHKENVKLLEELHFYDVLRADRGVATNGLEARVPYLNCEFIDMYLAIDPRLRVPYGGTSEATRRATQGGLLEKWLLRRAFIGYLPDEVLYRKKEAFSDGVSGAGETSWYRIIQDQCDKLWSNQEFEDRKEHYADHCPPITKEALFYRETFTQYFGASAAHVIPHFWLPSWCGNIQEPSARVLDVYQGVEADPF